MRLAKKCVITGHSAVWTVCLVLLGCGCSAQQAPDATLVQTASGAVRGAFADDHLLFAGIPYAAPPLGALRFRPPQPPPSWQGVRDASKSGPRCVQDTRNDPDFGRSISEDCLTLNVWTPLKRAEAPRPVLVWIHGGSFTNGSGDIYDSRWLADRGDIVVVTINYRLGALGFLAHPALTASGNAGNFGFEDQQAALRWVRDNIARFGGDEQKVTIAGESAGAMSVCDHLVAPGSAGLFRAAILQSGPCQAQGDLQHAQRVSIDYAAARGCADAARAAECLRALPAQKLNDPPLYYPFGAGGMTGPVTGTDALPIDPMKAVAQGNWARVPVLIGTNHDEWTVFATQQYLGERKMPDYPQVLADAFGADSARVAQQYPLSQYINSALAYSAAMTDRLFACPANQMESALMRDAPVYAYEFNDPNAPTPPPLRTAPFPVGAGHGLELRYLFDIGGAPALTDVQQKLSHQMIDYWSAFVATKEPRVDSAPPWPALRGAHGPWMSLQPPDVHPVTSFADEHKCGFWSTVPAPR
ncbi:MAG TPA: carboxylesterase family protein [Mycobacterium sp.]